MSCKHRIKGFVFAGFMLATFSLTPVWATDADDYVAEAQGYVAKGEFRAAVIQLKNALKDDPAHVQARLMLGTLYLRGSDAPAALKEFGRARELGAEQKDWLLGYAQALLMQREFSRVLDEITPHETLSVDLRADLHALRGNAHLALQQADQAEIEYDAALALVGDSPMAGLGKAQIMLRKQQNEAARKQLDQVIAAYPEHVETRLVRGDLHRRLRDLAAAEDDYRRAAEAAPNNPRAHIGLALVHLAQRNLDAAKQDLEVLHRLSPDAPAVNYLQALASFHEGDHDRASDELQKLLRVAPTNLQAQLLYGMVSYARNEFTIADDYLTRVLASAPGNLQVSKLLGAARLKLRQPDRAIEVLSTQVDENTQDAQLLALLGTAYIQSGDNSQGAKYIERAVELDPEQALLRTQLAVGKIASGDTGGAISQLESAVALGQDVIQADVLLVLSYLNKREFEKAITASEALEHRMAESPIPFNLTGLAFLAQRKFEPARERFELALEKDPDFLVARMNLARLAVVAERPDDAQLAYEKVLDKEPKHIGAMMGMAALARSHNDGDASERWVEAAHNADPKALQPIIVLAETYLRRNEALKAKNLLSGLQPPQGDLPAILRLRGMAQLQVGEYASAVFTLRKLTEAQPQAIEGWFQLARAQAAAGNSTAARGAFERAIELDAEHNVPVVWVGLAELDLRDKKYDAALITAEKIKQKFPDLVFGHDIEAAAWRGKGDIPASLMAAERALEIDRSSARINRFTRALAASGDTGRALTLLRDWLAEHADDGGAWSNLGMISQQTGEEEQALAAYEKAIGFIEPNPIILNNMAWLYMERDGKRAIELATQAYELAPTRAEIVDTYGWVLYRNGRESEGLSALQQALIIAPRNAEIALHVAEALHGMDRDTEARPILNRVLREHANTAFAESARNLLARLGG